MHNLEISRPDWKIKKNFQEIDLTKNVHFDKILNNKINNILSLNNYLFNYPNDYLVYKAISRYYKIPMSNLTIGFGATDLINRLFEIIDIKKLYIVNPSFAMVDIYCKAKRIDFEFIDFKDIKKVTSHDSAIYIVNPNGNNGEKYNIKKYLKNFKYIISDEVYADFYSKNSILNINLPNLIIIKSLSKSLGLAGLRLGFCKSSNKITKRLQNFRLSQITSSFASLIVPKVINETKYVIKRMIKTKIFLEKNFKCKKSYSNYVLFYNENKFTKKFGYKKIGKFYRMALTDMDTLLNYEKINK